LECLSRTTQAIIGGVVGVGLTKGIKTANWNTLKKIMLGWILAPACALVNWIYAI